MREIAAAELGPRSVVRAGDQVRLAGGGLVWRNGRANSTISRYAGPHRVIRCLQAGKRIYLLCRPFEDGLLGEYRLVLVAGPAHRNGDLGTVMRPARVVRPRAK